MSTTADTHHYHFLSLLFSLLSPFPFFLLNTMLVFLLIIRCTDTEKSTCVGGKFNSHTHTYTQTHTKDLSLVSITQNSNKSILQCVTWLLEDRFSALLSSPSLLMFWEMNSFNNHKRRKRGRGNYSSPAFPQSLIPTKSFIKFSRFSPLNISHRAILSLVCPRWQPQETSSLLRTFVLLHLSPSTAHILLQCVSASQMFRWQGSRCPAHHISHSSYAPSEATLK